jgi:DNA gyrase subunit A
MKLKEDEIVSAIVTDGEDSILTATEKGFGKRTALDEYRSQARGGLGLR